MIKAIIVDDEPNCCEILSTLLDLYCPTFEDELDDIIDEYGNTSGTEVIIRIRYKKPKIALT